MQQMKIDQNIQETKPVDNFLYKSYLQNKNKMPVK